ncbi:hypothetical protein Tco_1490596, partial [Tanacetum coccineum]
MSANDNFSLHDDEELSLHDDASLDGSVPASNKGDAPAKPPQIHFQTLNCPDSEWETHEASTKGKGLVYTGSSPTTQTKSLLIEERRKARTLLLMAVPKDHLRRFHCWMMNKEILAAIQDTIWWKYALKKQATNADDVDLIHEDLDQIDDLDLEEMDINWQIAMTAIKIKKFYKKTGRRQEWMKNGMWHLIREKLKLIDCGMSSTVKIGLGYGIQSNAEVLGYEEEISRGIFAFRETDAGYYDIPLYSRFKQVEYKGVPHPLSGDYTPREQEDIDDSLYEYGKYGPQPQSPSPTESDASSTVYSTCQSNDRPSIEQVTIATLKTQPQVSKPQQTVDPSCA